MLSNTFLDIPLSEDWLEYDPLNSIVEIRNATNIDLLYVYDTATGTPHTLFKDEILESIKQKIYFKVKRTGDNARVLITKGVADDYATMITDEAGIIVHNDPLVKSLVTTETFHHLGHEGKVFIHTDRHAGIADGANLDILIRIPAGNADRQAHMRFNYIGKANTGSLDIDIELYKDVIVSADGSPELIASTNDAVVKTTGVLMFSTPTVTDIGTFKAGTLMVGEKKSASSKEQSVPEWILAPNGTSARDYIMRATNNSGGTADIVTALFFYDSEAV